MEDKLFLGIDIGTTAIKFGIISFGNIVYEDKSKINTCFFENGSVYQKSEEIIQCVVNGISKIPIDLRKNISRISFSTAMHSLWLTNDQMEDGDISIWLDKTASEVVNQFKARALAKKFYYKTGTPIHEMTPFSKLLYLKEHKKDYSDKLILGLKELVMYHFTGEKVVDWSTASATGLYNIHFKKWDEEILHFLNIDESQLGKVKECTYETSILSSMAARLQLNADVKLVIGSSDGCMAALAGLKMSNFPSSLTIGTSAAIRKVSNRVILNAEIQNFCYVLSDKLFVIGAPSNNGGNVLEWISKICYGTSEDLFHNLPSILVSTTPGSNNVTFYPYVFGERAPLWNGHSKAMFKGLTAETGKEEIVRSVLEGIMFNLKYLLGMIGITETMCFSGGVLQNPLISQLATDILGVDAVFSKYCEPLFGLYCLLYEEKEFNETNVISLQKIHRCSGLSKRYDELFFQQYIGGNQYEL